MHPVHYRAPNGMQVIDVIEAFGLSFHLGNVVKYIVRCGRAVDRNAPVNAPVRVLFLRSDSPFDSLNRLKSLRK